MAKQTIVVGALGALALILAVAALTMAVGNRNSVDAEHDMFDAVFERLDNEQEQINALRDQEREDIEALIKRLDDEQEQINALRDQEREDIEALIKRIDGEHDQMMALIERINEEQDQIDALRARIEALERGDG